MKIYVYNMYTLYIQVYKILNIDISKINTFLVVVYTDDPFRK